MELYIFKDYRELFPELKGSALTDRLIQEALCEYGVKDAEVLRTEKGKPYAKASPGVESADAAPQSGLCISVSHTENFFVCLVADISVGVDIQAERRAGASKISRRYFSHEEIQYVEANGDKGFFILWTRKEAYCKYTGTGMEEIIKGTSVMGRDDVDFFDFKLEKGIYCSCCIERTKNANELNINRMT